MLAGMRRLHFLVLAAFAAGCSDAFVAKGTVDPGATESEPTDTDPTGTTPTEEAAVGFLTPGEEAASPVTLSVSSTGPVVRVAYYLESLPLVESTDAGAGFAATWRPDELGELTLEARAYNAQGEQVASDSTRTRVIDLAPDNRLGVWLEDNEIAGFTHDELAQRLASLGVKRVFIQTAGFNTGCESYPDGCDRSVPAAYHARGIETYAFAVPIPGFTGTAATNVVYVADAGYDGYVIHLTDDWGGEGVELDGMLAAFRAQVDENISIGRAPSNFPLYLSGGSSPVEIDLRVDVADGYVDGFLPRVLVESLGSDAIANPDTTLADVVCAYTSLGATHPIHPTIGTETGEVTALGVNRFFAVGGAGSSIWRVPDAGDPNHIWDTWAKVDWTSATLPDAARCD